MVLSLHSHVFMDLTQSCCNILTLFFVNAQTLGSNPSHHCPQGNSYFP